ncbi:response regulator [Deinococcus ruber]|uniref:Response regulator n=1 Tax=Deinococcus ruber TaxID=1848197 RepID=A0A918EZF7_9DEIO|nr:response regulator [Deinococcus ruber]GGQ93772.1 response regulator [Deinococcus ruber]
MTRILIVDDELQILELLDLSMTQYGFAVTTANSGPEAVQLLRSGRFDVVILDVLMSPWDGFETARHMRSLPGCPPIIFLSGVSGLAEQQRGLSLGAAFLSKPFRPSRLSEIIWQVLDEKTAL